MKIASKLINIFSFITAKPRVTFYVGCALLLMMFGTYSYFINQAVHNVVARENIQDEIAAISDSIGELEYKFMSLKNNVTLEEAYTRGFAEVEGPTYLSKSKTSSLSYGSTR